MRSAKTGTSPMIGNIDTQDSCDQIHTFAADAVDAVFDPVGGTRQIWRFYRTLRRGGRLVSFGMAAMSKSGVRVIPFSEIAESKRMSRRITVVIAQTNHEAERKEVYPHCES